MNGVVVDGAATILLCALHLLLVCIVECAPDGAEVLRFPGFDGDLPSKHYAGYITVGNQLNKRHLYYYFATSERDPENDPVAIWLNGGPGCSGLNAVVYLLGPFKVDDNEDYLINGARVKLNPYSWSKVSNMIYIDAPAGTGFSYADNTDDYIVDDPEINADIYEFILKWFLEYPEFLPNPFYVIGSSYGGMLVPVVSLLIDEGLEAGTKPRINFKGYSIGNAFTDIRIDNNAEIPYAHRMGLISDEQYKALKKSCHGNYWNSSIPDCEKNMEDYMKTAGAINKYHVLCLPCHFVMGITTTTNLNNKITQRNSTYGEMVYETDCGGAVAEHAHGRRRLPERQHPPDSIYCCDYNHRPSMLFNSESGRRDMHAQPIEVSGIWERCTKRLTHRVEERSLVEYHLNLTTKGYRAFIYNGDHDMVVSYLATMEWIKLLNYTEIEKWQPWFVGDQIAGYAIQYEHNLLYATFRGSGHTVPEYTPIEGLEAYRRWIDGSDSL
ncbi:serine carboxypeptidase 1 isoform X2 [Amborella trichopoda]|uniref:Uncharacterized protein n=1 Tax=Amborella trichopoda TaxID=13333 RepID=W1NW89_AMBTC|nr:serine carboxypeptidase 1 isoform X2 [Amborella trichopoda]ERN01902.1 hypothetical protein AMTR_s00089p00168750 [Amborella trichopoda]|eukprot:XP_006840227.1 serine carboxypeptidase 1 isoform X2 [Amborella trichopoda]